MKGVINFILIYGKGEISEFKGGDHEKRIDTNFSIGGSFDQQHGGGLCETSPGTSSSTSTRSSTRSSTSARSDARTIPSSSAGPTRKSN